MDRRVLAAAALAVGLVGCQGVPIGHYRYRASIEPAELLIGAVTLPFAVVGDALAMMLLIESDLMGKSLSLIDPFHNLLDEKYGPTECPALVEGVRVTRARREAALAGDAGAILAAARAHLEQGGWTIEPTREGRSPWKLHTAWRDAAPPAKAGAPSAKPAGPAAKTTGTPAAKPQPELLRRLHVRVYPPQGPGEPVRVRSRLELASPAGALVDASRFASFHERLAALEREKDEAEDALEDEDGDLITYYSKGKRGKKAYEEELEARRKPHRRRMEGAADDLLEVEDALFHARVDATREALQARDDQPLRALWDGLTAKFPPTR